MGLEFHFSKNHSLTVICASQVYLTGFPAIVSACVITPFRSTLWNVPQFAIRSASRASRDSAVPSWCVIAIPCLKMVRCGKVIGVTGICSNKVDTNAAQHCNKLEIYFHFPVIKSLLTKSNWSSLGNSRFICSHYC